MEVKKLRKRLLNWHYKKSRSISILDLLESGYQSFRIMVCNRVGKELDFREAIKQANESELDKLVQYRDEIRMKI